MFFSLSRIRDIKALTVAGLFFMVLSAPTAYACGCPTATLASSLEESDVVFSARITEVTRPAELIGTVSVKFHTDEVFKGQCEFFVSQNNNSVLRNIV